MSIDIPATCTLPTAERPSRPADFDELFATAVRGMQTVAAGHVRIRSTGPVGLETWVRKLTTRETTFNVSAEPATDGERVTVDVRVPAPNTVVLDSVVERARTVPAGGAS